MAFTGLTRWASRVEYQDIRTYISIFIERNVL
jgi:hypothetical protein